MKKIFAILCGATMMFAACTPNEGDGVVTPVFPEETTAEVLAGASYTLTFDANVAWTVSLENDLYAQLSYNNGEGTVFDTEVSGAEGEGIVVKVVVNDLKNYDADVVIPVTITMGGETKTLATLTVKKIERPEAIVLNTDEPTVTLVKNDWPSWGGEFPTAPLKYHLNYTDKWDLEGYPMNYNLENANIKVYAYNGGNQIAEASTISSTPWITVATFGDNGFKVVMDLDNPTAEWSWWDTQYEAYVNFEDGEGNLLASVFCTCTYNPNAVVAGESLVSFVDEETATAGYMSLTGSNDEYTLTYFQPMALDSTYSEYFGFKLEGAHQVNFDNEGEGLLAIQKTDSEEYGEYYYVVPMGDPTQFAVRNFSITVMKADWSMYTVHVVLDWVSAADPNALVSLTSGMASQVGVQLEGSGSEYTMTLYTPMPFDPMYAQYVGDRKSVV